jgi:hypothetical protein
MNKYCSIITVIFLISIGFAFNKNINYWLPLFFSICTLLTIYAFLKNKFNYFSTQDSRSKYNPIIFVLIWNILSLYLNRINGYDLSLKGHSFHISYMFGNFTDFWAASVFLNTFDGQKLMFTTGYYPFALGIANIFNIIIGFNVHNTVPMSRQYIWFIIYFIICYSAIFYYIYIKNKDNDGLKWAPYLVSAFVLTSYPFFVNYERGNYAIITFFLLTLAFINFDKDNKLSSIFITILLSLKILNIIFIPLFFYCKKRISVLSAFLIILLLELISFWFLSTTTADPFIFKDYISQLIGNLTSSGIFNFTNAQKIIGTSSLESLRLSIMYLYENRILDGGDINKPLNLVYAFLFLLTITSFCLKNKKNITSENLINLSLLCIIAAMLFHPMFADYNIIFILPFLIRMIYKQNLNQLSFLLVLYFMILVDYPLALIGCCGGERIDGRFVSLTIKPFVFVPISLMIIYYLFKISKEKP